MAGIKEIVLWTIFMFFLLISFFIFFCRVFMASIQAESKWARFFGLVVLKVFEVGIIATYKAYQLVKKIGFKKAISLTALGYGLKIAIVLGIIKLASIFPPSKDTATKSVVISSLAFIVIGVSIFGYAIWQGSKLENVKEEKS